MSDTFWYTYNPHYEREEGPYSEDEMVEKIESGEVKRDSLVYSDQMANWEPAGRRQEFNGFFGESRESTPPPPPAPTRPTVAHEIDYEVHGEDMQYVEITLDPQEACVAEAARSCIWTQASR